MVASNGNNSGVNLWMMAPGTTVSAKRRALRFADRNLTDASDLSLQAIQAEVCDFFANEVFQLKGMEAIPLNSGTQSNLQAIHLAAHSNRHRLVVCSDLSHKSIAQAGEITHQTVRPLYCSSKNNFRVPRQDLINFLNDHGNQISCLVITMGTTQLGTVNDFPFDEEIARLIKSKGIWLHVDAAMGIQTQLTSSNETTRLLLDNADSMMTDPHKFVGVMDLSLLYVKAEQLRSIRLADQHYFQGVNTAFGTTRGGFPMAAAYHTICDWGGLNGVRKVAEECRARALALASELKKAGYNLVTEPETTIITVDMGKRNGQPLGEDNGMSQEERAQHRTYSYQALLCSAYGIDVGQLRIDSTEQDIYGLRIVITPKKQITERALQTTARAFHEIGKISQLASAKERCGK